MSSLGCTNTSMTIYTNVGANKANYCGGIRKGSWTDEEDNLLRKCIEKYGEGNWHRIPLRSGLNRCRKSCRLRWMNYLKPNIKRGEFNEDEVDLILRLHKLLGNRWSLIAGRIPGRTANDIKNYWNTHIHKKITPPSLPPKYPNTCEKPNQKHTIFAKTTTTKNLALPNQIIRPKPQSFTKSSSLMMTKPDPLFANLRDNVGEDENVNWWENLLEMHDKEDNEIFNGSSHEPTNHSYNHEMQNIWEDNNLWNYGVNI